MEYEYNVDNDFFIKFKYKLDQTGFVSLEELYQLADNIVIYRALGNNQNPYSNAVILLPKTPDEFVVNRSVVESENASFVEIHSVSLNLQHSEGLRFVRQRLGDLIIYSSFLSVVYNSEFISENDGKLIRQERLINLKDETRFNQATKLLDAHLNTPINKYIAENPVEETYANNNFLTQPYPRNYTTQ